VKLASRTVKPTESAAGGSDTTTGSSTGDVTEET
jgi:hypothetical protein